MEILKSVLCSNRPDMPLKFEVWDYATNSGNHKLVGGTIMTYNEILKKVKTSVPLIIANGKQQGTLSIEFFSESRFL